MTALNRALVGAQEPSLRERGNPMHGRQQTAGIALAGFGAVPLFAFAGGILTILLVYTMARVGRTVPVMTLLLAGIAVSAFLSALVSLLMHYSGRNCIWWCSG